MRVTLTVLFVVLAAVGTALASTGTAGAEEPSGELVAQLDPTAAPPAAEPASGRNPVVLQVNGEPVRAFEISMIMQTIQAQLKERGQDVNPNELAQTATQRAIEQKLLAQEARRFGLVPEELDVARAAEAAEKQAGGRTILESKLQASGATYDELLGVIREIELVRMLVEQRIQPNVEVTDEEIASFYRDNPELFEAGERVHAYHMVFIVSEDAPAEEQAAARAKAEAARARALEGVEEFTAIAKQLSEGPTAPNGGDLGWVTRDGIAGPLAEAVFALEPGDISPVVRTRFGFHVTTVSERRPAETISLEVASDQIRAALRRQKTAETVAGLLDTLVKSAKVENLIGTTDAVQTPTRK